MIKKYYKYLIVFIFSLSVLVLFGFSRNTYDSIWNYAFSFGIAHGQLPYVDYPIVIPLLYNFVMSVGLFIWNNNLMFLIEQAFLITICFSFLYKMYEEKSWLFLIFLCGRSFLAFMPTYNFFLFFLLVIVIYLEKKEANDYLVGFFLGCLILTKHTVGIFFIIPTFIMYYKDLKKIGKRALGCLAPWIIFLIYLLITNSLWQFIDLCILGLFDFATSNTVLITPYFFISIFMFIINLLLIVKNLKNITYWYVLFSFMIMIPIFTCNHFFIYLLFFSLLIIESITISNKKLIYIITISYCVIIVFLNFFMTGAYKNIERLDDINHFEYYIGLKGTKNSIIQINNLYKKYKKIGHTKILSDNTMWIEMINDEKFNYLSILNKGNHGYNGSKKLINNIQKMQDTYFIIDYVGYQKAKNKVVDNYYQISQFDYSVVDYIMDNSKEVESFNNYRVFYHE